MAKEAIFALFAIFLRNLIGFSKITEEHAAWNMAPI